MHLQKVARYFAEGWHPIHCASTSSAHNLLYRICRNYAKEQRKYGPAIELDTSFDKIYLNRIVIACRERRVFTTQCARCLSDETGMEGIFTCNFFPPILR